MEELYEAIVYSFVTATLNRLINAGAPQAKIYVYPSTHLPTHMLL